MSSALQRWEWLVASVNGRGTIGQPGVRDPEYPCEAFEPGDPEPDATCMTDGHYMCNECVRRASCEDGCGQRPNSCACEDIVYGIERFFQRLSLLRG